MSSERLVQLEKATEQDPVLQTLKMTVLIGWPEQRSEVPISIREYGNYRGEVSLHNVILSKRQRIIVPKVMRSAVILKSHASHLSITACLRKA